MALSCDYKPQAPRRLDLLRLESITYEVLTTRGPRSVTGDSPGSSLRRNSIEASSGLLVESASPFEPGRRQVDLCLGVIEQVPRCSPEAGVP